MMKSGDIHRTTNKKTDNRNKKTNGNQNNGIFYLVLNKWYVICDLCDRMWFVMNIL